jgi:ABC-type polysaccharide/polyol phosphate transport system ATPase subunit
MSEPLAPDVAIDVKDALFEIVQPRASLLDRVVEALPFGRRETPTRASALTTGPMNFKIRKATRHGLLVSSATARSKLYDTIVGDVKPTSGEVRVAGSVSSAVQIRRQFSRRATVLDELRRALWVHRSGLDEAERNWEAAILFAGMLDSAHSRMRDLSELDHARLATAACVFRKADIYLLDELSLLQVPSVLERIAGKTALLGALGKTVVLASVNPDWLRRNCNDVATI